MMNVWGYNESEGVAYSKAYFIVGTSVVSVTRDGDGFAHINLVDGSTIITNLSVDVVLKRIKKAKSTWLYRLGVFGGASLAFYAFVMFMLLLGTVLY